MRQDRDSNATIEDKPAGSIPADGVAGGLQSIKLLLPVWGQSYINTFFDLCLPTLLSPGNLPALVAALPCQFELLTSAEDEGFIRRHPGFKALNDICPTVLRPIDHLITARNYSTTLTLAWAEAVRATGDAMLDTCFFFLVSDYIIADGSLANALERIRAGASAVQAGNFQVRVEEAVPWLRKKIKKEFAPLTIGSRELVGWALAHLHPTTVANIVNNPLSHNSHSNRLFWRVDEKTLLGRFYLMHMLCIRPEVTDFAIGSSCDYSFVPEMCPSGNITVMADSDEYLVVEMQPGEHESYFLRPGALSEHTLIRSLAEWTTEHHRRNASTDIVFHAADAPPALAEFRKEAEGLTQRASKALEHIKPQPTRNHRYWRGAIAAFRESKGERLGSEEQLYLQELHSRQSHWVERVRWAVYGKAPQVRPWHPRWPDFRVGLERMEPYLANKNSRILALSEQPTPFTLMLAELGDERVTRLETSRLLKKPARTYEPYKEKFDFCLVEIDGSTINKAAELIERITPLMKRNGAILLSITSEFADPALNTTIAAQAYRILSPRAWVKEVHFVPASRFRINTYRAFASLGAMAHKRPALGIPALAALSLPLTVATALTNLREARTTRQYIDDGAFASSVHVLFEVGDNPGEETARGDSAGECENGNGMREQQYNRCLELKDEMGAASLGLMSNQVWHDDPRRLAFVMARYKFVAKMLSGKRRAAEVGCGDAFASRIVQQEVESLTVYDFDPLFIKDIEERKTAGWELDARLHDVLSGPLPEKHDAIYSLDVLEHIDSSNESRFLTNIVSSLTEDGVLIVGSPSLESQQYASPQSKEGHVNCKTGAALKELMEEHFHSVFLFSMNDEVVHTGFSPMAHYLIALCAHKK